MTPNLTPAQLETLKAAILADPILAAHPNGGDGNLAIAQALNLDASPAVIVWRTFVSWDTIMTNGMDWTRVDNLSVGKQRIWEWMFRNSQNAIDPSKPNIRAGIDATWVGTTADLNVRAAVYVHCKRNASRAEALYETGAGTDANPGTLVNVGPLTPTEVETARNLP